VLFVHVNHLCSKKEQLCCVLIDTFFHGAQSVHCLYRVNHSVRALLMLSRSKSCLSVQHIVWCCVCFMADMLRKKIKICPIGNRYVCGDETYDTRMQPICISSSLYFFQGAHGVLSLGLSDWCVKLTTHTSIVLKLRMYLGLVQ